MAGLSISDTFAPHSPCASSAVTARSRQRLCHSAGCAKRVWWVVSLSVCTLLLRTCRPIGSTGVLAFQETSHLAIRRIGHGLGRSARDVFEVAEFARPLAVRALLGGVSPKPVLVFVVRILCVIETVEEPLIMFSLLSVDVSRRHRR